MGNIHVITGLSLRLLITFIALVLCVSAHGVDVPADKIVEIKAEQLPDLNIARSGHVTLCLDGELTVFGGHTEGFTLTATAEYLRDGQWQIVPLAYPHDHGIGLELRSGKVFLAGGHKEPLGIDRLFSAEIYDPTTHSSRGFGCMSNKRAFANAIEMADGQVVIAGNWYADDDVEMFANVTDPACTNAVKVKDVALNRSKPYIMKIADDNAIIFSSLGGNAEPIDCDMVDRLNGEAYREPFLDTWRPIATIIANRSMEQFIGDETNSNYEWLLPVENQLTGALGIARVKGPTSTDSLATFSLLDTELPLPDSIQGKEIIYSSLICDRERGIAYLIGDDDDARICAISIGYASPAPAPVIIYITEPQAIRASSLSPALTSDGDIVFAGGHLVSNFSPSNAVVRLPLGNADEAAAAPADSSDRSWLLWIIVPCLLGCAVGTGIVALKKHRNPEMSELEVIDPQSVEDIALDKNMPREETLAVLFKRIEQLMDEERPYLNANLKVSDVAVKLGSNITYVSAAINSQRGCSFSQFLTSYRITYAQELMRQNPDGKISAISTQSGFSTDSTFFRAFRASTGMSPKEWLAAVRKD